MKQAFFYETSILIDPQDAYPTLSLTCIFDAKFLKHKETEGYKKCKNPTGQLFVEPWSLAKRVPPTKKHFSLIYNYDSRSYFKDIFPITIYKMAHTSSSLFLLPPLTQRDGTQTNISWRVEHLCEAPLLYPNEPSFT